MEFDCFLCGKELLCMDSTAHEMKGLMRDQVLSMHHLTKQLRTFENLPYHVSVNDVSEMIVFFDCNYLTNFFSIFMYFFQIFLGQLFDLAFANFF